MVEVGLVALKRLGFSVRYIDLEGKDVIRLPASPSSSEVQTVVMFRALPQSFQPTLFGSAAGCHILVTTPF